MKGESVWPLAETHCALCERPFPTEVERKKHAGVECEPECWCEAFCWVTEGGDCVAELSGYDPITDLVLPLRAALASERSRADRLEQDLERLREGLAEIEHISSACFAQDEDEGFEAIRDLSRRLLASVEENRE